MWYIFRHGETEFNKEGILQGKEIDSSLNENGLKQAEKISKFLLNKNIKTIFSSPLKRAKQTAEIVANDLKVNIILNNSLSEIAYGEASGKKKQDLEKLFGEGINEKWSSDDPTLDNIKFLNGESKIEVRERVFNFINDLIKSTNDDVLCLSSHGFVIKQLIILAKENNHKGLKNCELVHFKIEDNGVLKFIERINTQIDS